MNKYLSDELINDTYSEDSKIEHLEKMVIEVLKNMDAELNETYINKIEAMKAFQIINMFCKENDFEQLDIGKVSLSGAGSNFTSLLKNYLDNLFKNYIELYNNPFVKKNNTITITEKETIQALLNKLRDKVEADTNLEEEHKRRILKKLNEMQTELNKKVCDLDILGGKIMGVVKGMHFFSKEVASPLLKDATELAKAINKIDSKNNGIPEDYQIQIGNQETIETVETTDIPQIENK